MYRCLSSLYFSFFFFFNDTATTEIYTLSLHDALPIYALPAGHGWDRVPGVTLLGDRSEEHTSELQSPWHLVCRLLLEKKNRGETCGRAKHTRTLPGRDSWPRGRV